jgi:type IV secretion/conjugal transfer VirB4 family ATPase
MSTFFLIVALLAGGAVFLYMLLNNREAYGSAADVLNWGSLVNPGMVVCKDGSFVAGWEVRGLDTESIEPAMLEALLARLGRGLSNFSEGDTFWMRLDRRPFVALKTSSDETLPIGVRLLEEDSKAQLVDGCLFSNALHLCIQHVPADPNAPISEQVEEFERLAAAVENRLGSALRLRRLSSSKIQRAKGQDVLTDELVDHLASVVSGRARKLRLAKETEHMYLDSFLAVDFKQDDLDSFIEVDGRVCAVLSIEGLPAEYPEEVLEELERLDFEYGWVSRFAPQSRAKTRATVKALRKQWRQSGADMKAQIAGTGGGDTDVYADAMAQEIEDITYDVGRSGAVYGSFASTLIIFAPEGSDLKEMRLAVERINGALQDVGFMMREERQSALEVFLSTLPGHGHRRPRDVYLSSRNFADLLPIRTLWKGEEYCPSPYFPSKSPSLMQGRSASGELFRFNLHHGDAGHTMIFGPTRAGKSVLLGAIVGNFLKYPSAQVIFFDKGRSIQRTSHVFEGSFTDFGGEHGHGVAPIEHVLTLGRDWAVRWLIQMMRGGGVDVTTDQIKEIGECVDSMTETKKFSLNVVRNFLSSKDMRTVVDKYLASSVLNTPSTSLDWKPLTVFETHELFDADEATAVLVLDYLFAAVEKRFTGQPTLLVLDEAWSFLGHEIFSERLRRWLKEAAKSNVAIIIATQSLEDVVSSSLVSALSEGCFTKIYLPNAGAKTELASEQYKALGVNEAQIDLIAGMVPKQDYYLVKPGVARVIDFAFGELTLSMVGQTSKAQSTQAAAAFSKDPMYWMKDVERILETAISSEERI